MNRSILRPLRLALYVYLLLILIASWALGGVQNVTEITPSGGDDSAQIQAAIDAVRATVSRPGGDAPHGGKVRLARGVFLIQNASILLYSGVTLEGVGTGTVLVTYDGYAADDLIRLAKIPAQEAVISQASVRNLRLVSFKTSGAGSGIALHDATQVLNCIFENLSIASPGRAIDLEGAYTQACRFRDLKTDGNPGIGDSFLVVDGNVNTLSDMHVEADLQDGTYADWQNDRPIFDLRGGGGSFKNITIEPFFSSGQSGYAVKFAKPAGQTGSGWVWENIHLELGFAAGASLTNGYAVDIADTYLSADNFHFLYYSADTVVGKVNIGPNSSVYLGYQETRASLPDTFTLANGSYLRILQPHTQGDVGWLEKSNVSLGDAINGLAGKYVRNPVRPDGQNLVKHAPLWQITPAGGIVYSTISQETGSRTLSLNVSAAPGGSTLTITVPLRDTAADVARWKVSLPAGAAYAVYTDGLAQQLRASARNTRTAAPIPVATKTLVFRFTNLATGTYTIDELLAGDEVIE
jgi:hypothetical protein